MNLLALDTSTEWLSVAAGPCDGTAGRWHVQEKQVPAGHSGKILPFVQAVLADAKLSLPDIDGIALNAGPGSFTGIRIGCGVALGLALGSGLPVVPVSGLTAMAETAFARHGWRQVLVALDARMHEVYVTALIREEGAWTTVLPMQVKKPSALVADFLGGIWHGVGDGFAVAPELTPLVVACDATIRPNAQAIAQLALPRLQRGDTCAADQVAPIYLRNRVALTLKERAAGEHL